MVQPVEKTPHPVAEERRGRAPSAACNRPLSADIFDQLQDAFLTTDLQGNITACNKGVSLYGYAPEELLGKNIAGLYRPEEQVFLARQVIPTVLEKGRFEGELRSRAKSGEDVFAHLSITLLRDSDSIPLGMAVLAIDITDKKLLERAFESGPARSAPAAAIPSEIIRREIDGTQFLMASPLMHKFMGMVDRVAGHTETVLVVGETGTGKELVARTIHESSHRRNRPLIDINCAALPEHLVESELFGYEKGAFSGADASKAGLFELADKGTIFLDEIGELQTQIQVKLLRVLDGAPYYRLGGHRKITVDVRVVAATNQDLELAVKEGKFRKDLYHRLSQFQLRVPPLRERPEDIVALAQHFLQLKVPGKTFTEEALAALVSCDWPGNIRELRNLVAQLAMAGTGKQIGLAEVQEELSGERPAAVSAGQAMPLGNLENMEEQMIISALERTGGHRAQAAEQLGISRRTLSRKLREYDIDVAAGDRPATLGKISLEQQKFFRAKVNLSVTLQNLHGKECQAQAVNLSTGGMGLDSIPDPVAFTGLLGVSFVLPDSETVIQAKGRLVWADVGGKAGLRFVVIEPTLFEHLQHWTNRKMKDEGWEFTS
ncbi:MAG: sigma 54-interacting transcriptional regulator [Acidobacteria bacterium]|nr:sigma 54-interacting transcriptional regulator [Acidobacteriota bacterium]